jgi:hypothetical protein
LTTSSSDKHSIFETGTANLSGLTSRRTTTTRFAIAIVFASLLSGAAVAQVASPTPAPTVRPPTATTSTTSAIPKPSATSAASTQFADEIAAKSHCPADTVVWVNLSSKVYHLTGTPYYGKTKKGAYICQKDADASGFRVAKDEAATGPKH